MSHIKDLLNENIILILSFLRATDLASVREVDNTIFSATRVDSAIEILVKEVYVLNIPAHLKKVVRLETSLRRPDFLFFKEIGCISSALTAIQPEQNKGYWISTTWLSNAKKYYETLNNIEMDSSPKKSPAKKKQPKQRQRRGSDALPPWPAMNVDITCVHGGLAISTSNHRSKRRTIQSRMWHFLRRFYPEGPEFKCSYHTDCALCMSNSLEAMATKSEKKDVLIMERKADLVPDILIALSVRKSGIPMHCATARVVFYNEISEGLEEPLQHGYGNNYMGTTAMPPAAAGLSALLDAGFPDDVLQQPLIPGLYNLVPRNWLKAWRHYIKDISAPFLPHLDCTSLICQQHGLLVIPPHIEEYLIGLRRTLLGGLGIYPGEVAEIVSADEWDALQDVFHGAADFSVRFCLDGAGVSWNIGVCMVCDPFSYNPVLVNANKKKSRNSQPVAGTVL